MNSFFLLPSGRYYLFGSIIVVVLILMIYLLTFTSSNSRYNTYIISAQDTENISKGTGVFLFGYEVGRVKNIYLNKREDPIIVLSIENSIKIPNDSSISAKLNNWLSGSKVLQIDLGIDYDNIIPNNGQILYFNSGLSVGSIIDGLLMYINGKKNKQNL